MFAMPMPEDFLELARKVNNWGRWGDDDEVGTLNLITADVVRRGAACITRGEAFPLAIPLSLDGPQTGAVRGRINPLKTMVAINEPLTGDVGQFCSSDDVVTMGMLAGTHWDALAHVSYDGRLWNGFPASSIGTEGASRGGIDKVRRLVGRAVLLDVARAKGLDRLEPGYAITADELDATAEAQGVEIRTGDAIVVRTGMTETRRGAWGDYNGGPAPGLSLHTAPWLHAHDVAAIATDTWGCEVRPNEIDLFQPLHVVALVHMGIPFGEIWDLEAIGRDCAEDGVYEFLLSAPTLPITGAAGSPLNALAVK